MSFAMAHSLPFASDAEIRQRNGLPRKSLFGLRGSAFSALFRRSPLSFQAFSHDGQQRLSRSVPHTVGISFDPKSSQRY
jgi:hypothetical protein